MSFWDKLPKSELERKHEELEQEVASMLSFKHLTPEEETQLAALKKTKLQIKDAIAKKDNGKETESSE